MKRNFTLAAALPLLPTASVAAGFPAKDKVLQRTLSHAYEIRALPIAG